MNRIIFTSVFLLASGMLFSQKLIPFEKNGKFGFKNSNQDVIPATFDYVCDFTEGLALVKQQELWGFIDSLGNWKITPQFEKAQPFVNGVSYVEKGKKIGLLKSDGSTLIPIAYENIVEDYNGYFLIGGNRKKGYLSKEGGDLIQPNYEEISLMYDVAVGKTDKGTYDIYYKGKLQVKDVWQKPSYSDIEYRSEIIILTTNGLSGLYQFNKGWIVPQEYAWIGTQSFTYYSVEGSDQQYNFIYALHSKDLRNFNIETDWDFESPLPVDSILLLKADGKMISPIKFNNIVKAHDPWSDLVNSNVMMLSQDGILYNLKENFTLEKLRFSNLTPVMNDTWFVGESGGMNYLLNSNQFVVDSFPSIKQYFEYTYDPEVWTDYGEPEMMLSPVNEPFLIVRSGSGVEDLDLWAIYSLEEQRRVTPWLKSSVDIVVNRFQFNYNVIYSYGFGAEVGFYTEGMDLGTELIYSYGNGFPSLNNNFIAYKASEDLTSYELYELKDSKVTKTYTADKIYSSEEVMDLVWIYDTITGEEYLNEIKKYEIPFFVIESKNGKFGLVAQNGKVIEPNYDYLTANETNSLMIVLGQGNKFGNVYLPSGEHIEPFADSMIQMEISYADEPYPLVYTKVIQGNDYYYLDANGKRFNCLIETIYPKKVKGKYALVGYSENPDNDSQETIQLPAQYKMITASNKAYVFKAKGLNKKMGLISFKGDTIAPFQYSKFTDIYWELPESENYLMTSIKKKKGIVHLNKGEIIPCEFDNVTQFVVGDYYLNAFEVTKNGKKGLYSHTGKLIFPCEYESFEIQVNENYFELYTVHGIKNGKRHAQFFDNTYGNVTFMPSNIKGYDYIIGEEGHIRTANGFDIYNIRTGLKINSRDVKDISRIGVSYDIKMVNGKFGAVDKNGTELIPCIYDMAEFFEGRDEVMIGYEKGVKYYIYVFTKERYTEQEW